MSGYYIIIVKALRHIERLPHEPSTEWRGHVTPHRMYTADPMGFLVNRCEDQWKMQTKDIELEGPYTKEELSAKGYRT